MKLGLISDVHGDPAALALALAHLATIGVDRILCAGDVVGYGSSPDQAVSSIEGHGIASVRGNHDRWALERGPGMADEFGGATPSDATLAYLASLPTDLALDLGTRIAVVVHGSPRSDMEFITRRDHPPEVLDRYLRDLDCDLLVTGHTHRPMWYRAPSGRLVVNPGSVISIPLVDSSRTFAVVDLEELAVTFHEVESGQPREVAHWA